MHRQCRFEEKIRTAVWAVDDGCCQIIDQSEREMIGLSTPQRRKEWFHVEANEAAVASAVSDKIELVFCASKMELDFGFSVIKATHMCKLVVRRAVQQLSECACLA